MHNQSERLTSIGAKRTPFPELVREEGRANAAELARWLGRPGRTWKLADPRNWLEASDWDIDDWGKPVSTGRILGNAFFAFSSKQALVDNTQSYFEAYAAEQSHPYRGDSRVPVPASPVARLWADTFSNIRAAFVGNEAEFALLQTQVAILRFRAAHGRYPDGLPALVPAYLKAVPTDPFGLGKPLKYKPLDGGKRFLLYSLGPNLKDDGGTHSRPAGASAPGDIVAGQW